MGRTKLQTCSAHFRPNLPWFSRSKFRPFGNTGTVLFWWSAILSICALLKFLFFKGGDMYRTYILPKWHISIPFLLQYFTSTCILGWVDFGLLLNFQQKFPWDLLYIPSKSTKNTKKQIFDPVTASSLVMTFWVVHYKGYKILYSQYGLHGYQNTQNFT
jgi:hypothetical protein